MRRPFLPKLTSSCQLQETPSTVSSAARPFVNLGSDICQRPGAQCRVNNSGNGRNHAARGVGVTLDSFDAVIRWFTFLRPSRCRKVSISQSKYELWVAVQPTGRMRLAPDLVQLSTGERSARKMELGLEQLTMIVTGGSGLGSLSVAFTRKSERH
jgi:hypothetical protein